MYKRRPYLLLELMIGFVLLSAIAIPCFFIPRKSFESESKILLEMEIERLGELECARCEELFYCNQIAWEAITNKFTPIDSPKKISIKIPDVGQWEYTMDTKVKIVAEPEKKEGNLLRHIFLRCSFTPTKKNKLAKKLTSKQIDHELILCKYKEEVHPQT